MALEQAKDLMRQLGLNGEIDWLATPPDPARLDFRVSRPGFNVEVKASFADERAVVQRTTTNSWAVVRVLHTFTGTRQNDPRNRRDWAITTAWALAMDAVAAGLIAMVLNGLIMWWGMETKRRYGLIALGSGLMACGWFVFGLRWIYS
jgi:hypothetical protein